MIGRGAVTHILLAVAAGGLAAATYWWTSDAGDVHGAPSAGAAVGAVPARGFPAVAPLAAGRLVAALEARNQAASEQGMLASGAASAGAAYKEREPRVSLGELVALALITTPTGRSHAMAELALAEDLARKRLQVVHRERDERVVGVKAADGGTVLVGAPRLEHRIYAAELQAISVSRSLVVFMEENQAAYDVVQGQPIFRNAGMTVQFDHYVAQANRAIGRVSSVERESGREQKGGAWSLGR